MNRQKRKIFTITLITIVPLLLPTGHIIAYCANSDLFNKNIPIYASEVAATSYLEDIATPVPGDSVTPVPSNSVTPVSGDTVTPVLGDSVTPLPDDSVTPVPGDSVTPLPTIVPTVIPTAIPTPSPIPDEEEFVTKTLSIMQAYDYVNESITGIGNKKLTLATLNKKLIRFGKLTKNGMGISLYNKVMKNGWVDVTEYNKKPVKVTMDMTKTLNYSAYVSTLKKLSRYDGVYLYKIGKSTDGRDMYSIEIDMDSTIDKEVFMFTGQTHSREFAGGIYILKQFSDLIQNAQTDKETMKLLKQYKYVAVPIISLDVREGLINNPSMWATSGGQLWKAYSNGTDGNRNYPGLQWGAISHGNKLNSSISSSPGYGKYQGPYAGSASETQAMMKWLYHYVVVEQAIYHIDYHQQGSIIYAGKPWQTKAQEERCIALKNNIMKLLNTNNKRKYSYMKELSNYGFDGVGSTATDFSVSLAVGAKFSTTYGFFTFVSKNKEYTLMEIRDLDTTKVNIKEANQKFATVTVEIGYGTKYLGNSSYARRMIATEYTKYHYDDLLENLPSFIKTK